MSTISQSKKLCTITWSSKYRGLPKESKVFGPEAEEDIVKQTLLWIIKNNKGIDTDAVREIMEENNELNADEDDGENVYLIKTLVSQCNSVKDLKRICKKYDSYYGDKEGWKFIVRYVDV